MKTMFVYILECSDESYYVGVTNDLKRRFEEHENGVNNKCYTYNKRPLKVVFYQTFTDPTNAILCEKKLKGWSRAKKKALIENNVHLLPKLSKNKQKESHASTGSA